MFAMSQAAGNHVTAHVVAGRALKYLLLITITYAYEGCQP